jgi:hypothetical protein
MIEGDRLYKRVTDNATRDPTLQLIVGGGLVQATYNNVQLGFCLRLKTLILHLEQEWDETSRPVHILLVRLA